MTFVVVVVVVVRRAGGLLPYYRFLNNSSTSVTAVWPTNRRPSRFAWPPTSCAATDDHSLGGCDFVLGNQLCSDDRVLIDRSLTVKEGKVMTGDRYIEFAKSKCYWIRRASLESCNSKAVRGRDTDTVVPRSTYSSISLGSVHHLHLFMKSMSFDLYYAITNVGVSKTRKQGARCKSIRE